MFGNLGYFLLISLSLSLFLSPSRRLHQHHSIINPAAALICWLFTVAHRCCLPLSHPAERSAEAITHRLKHLKRYQGVVIQAFKTARNLHSENFTVARNQDKVCLLLSLMLGESCRQQPKRDRKPEVARQLENYVLLIPIMGPSTGHLDWSLSPNHLEPFSVRFSDKETGIQNGLLLATRTVQMNFVRCRTSVSIPCVLCSEKR